MCKGTVHVYWVPAPNTVALSIAVSTLKTNLSPSSWASIPALLFHTHPSELMDDSGCVSAYIGSALHGFQLKLSGTCTQCPAEIKVGKQINMHRGEHSSKTNIPPQHAYTHIHDTHRPMESVTFVYTSMLPYVTLTHTLPYINRRIGLQ